MDAGACLRLQASPSRPPAEALSAGVPYRRDGGHYGTLDKSAGANQIVDECVIVATWEYVWR